MSNIEWKELITKEMKEASASAQALVNAAAEIARLRAVADFVIPPLQDAVDIDDATDAEIARLKAWKKYRSALGRLPDQPGYPKTIDWPVVPA
jgi:hypothetical protein